MAANGYGSRSATPNGMSPFGLNSAAPPALTNSRPAAQIPESRRISQIPGGRLDDVNNRTQTTYHKPDAGMYAAHQGGFKPRREIDEDIGYNRSPMPSYGQGLGRGNSRNTFDGQPYSQGSSQYQPAPNDDRTGHENYGFNGFQTRNIDHPSRRHMTGASNIVPRNPSGGPVERHMNSDEYYRPSSNANPAYSAPYSEPVEQPNSYPQFRDGDVRIISPSGKVWKLHSIILKKASPVFAHLLDTTPGLHISRRMKEEGNAIRWNMIMTAENRADDIDPEGLKYMKFDKINSKDKSFNITNHNGLGEVASYNRLYDNFFRCVYNMEPKFTNDNDPQARAMIMDATALLQAAVWLEAVPCVRMIIEANFLRLNQVLWKHIGDRPEGWIHIAARLQSPLMFRECLIHIVGKYHLDNGINRGFLNKRAHGPLTPKIWALIVQKAKELKDKKLRVERVLLEFYPIRMIHKENTETIPGRAIYAADIYLWQALVIFRQFVTSAFFSNYHHKAKDGGLSFYRTLGAGDATYLRADTLDKFHQSFDMSPKAKGLLIAALEQIKAEAKTVVAELLVDRSQMVRAPNERPREHLTCTEVLDEEMPWIVAGNAVPEDDLEMDHNYDF